MASVCNGVLWCRLLSLHSRSRAGELIKAGEKGFLIALDGKATRKDTVLIPDWMIQKSSNGRLRRQRRWRWLVHDTRDVRQHRVTDSCVVRSSRLQAHVVIGHGNSQAHSATLLFASERNRFGKVQDVGAELSLETVH